MDIDSFENIINKTKERLNIPISGSWNEKVKKVVVLLSASRSGSSLVKTVLSQNNNVAYSSGEEEPWLLLTKNSFPFIDSLLAKTRNKQKLLDYFHHDFGINSDVIDKERFAQRWRNRLLLQFPKITDKELQKIPRLIDNIFVSSVYNKNSIRQFLQKFSGVNLGYYDLFGSKKTYYKEDVIIEQPPYVIPAYTKPLLEKDYETKYFLFKSPQDSYRLGIWEALFPKAKIFYIHLTRGFAQTINSLMDGWSYPAGFHAYDVSLRNKKLDIDGYHDSKWWKFDLPPNWMEYTNSSLEEVCLNQWHQANDYILKFDKDLLSVKFEDFISNPNQVLRNITDYIGMPPLKRVNLPLIMITKRPKRYRWHKRKSLLLEISETKKVKEMMGRLGYGMDPKEWV